MAVTMVLPCGGNVFANTMQQGTYVALGDSISTGYKLENKDSDSFASKLAKAYNKKLINLAKDGSDSTILLNMLNSTDAKVNEAKQSLKSADMITLTVGGNNILGPLMTTIKRALNLEDTATSEQVQQALLTNQDVLIKIYQQFQNPETIKLFSDEITSFAVEFPEIIKNIKTLNPNAPMVVQTVYNPLDKINGLSELSKLADEFIKRINGVIVSNSLNTYKVADVYTAFKSNTSDTILTNIA